MDANLLLLHRQTGPVSVLSGTLFLLCSSNVHLRISDPDGSPSTRVSAMRHGWSTWRTELQTDISKKLFSFVSRLCVEIYRGILAEGLRNWVRFAKHKY